MYTVVPNLCSVCMCVFVFVCLCLCYSSAAKCPSRLCCMMKWWLCLYVCAYCIYTYEYLCVCVCLSLFISTRVASVRSTTFCFCCNTHLCTLVSSVSLVPICSMLKSPFVSRKCLNFWSFGILWPVLLLATISIPYTMAQIHIKLSPHVRA